jgi:hypothetical protein
MPLLHFNGDQVDSSKASDFLPVCAAGLHLNAAFGVHFAGFVRRFSMSVCTCALQPRSGGCLRSGSRTERLEAIEKDRDICPSLSMRLARPMVFLCNFQERRR